MKNNFCLCFFAFKIFLFSNYFTYSSSLGNGKGRDDKIGECRKDNVSLINSCLNNINIFENTNGDIYLGVVGTKLIFGATFSNNSQRAFYAITHEKERYLIKKNDNIYTPFLVKNITRTENKEIYNGDISIYRANKKDIMFIYGTDGSYIEILNINQYTDDFILVSPNNFIQEDNKIIKGISSLFYIALDCLIYGTITMTKNNVSDYYISLYSYTYSFTGTDNLSFNYNLKYKIDFDDIKGEYLSCFVYNSKNNHISCFYLSKDNNYTIILVNNYYVAQIGYGVFSKKRTLRIGSPSDPNDDNFYFFKSILLGANNCIYMYYSGNSNDIPTFLFKTIDDTNFSLYDTYSNFSVVYLNEKYEFNNGIKYNDISCYDYNKIYFVSSSKNKETLIIAYFFLYLTSTNGLNNNNLVIRYYILELKKYYNMKIFHGFKTAIFSSNIEPFLSLGFDFCYSNNSIDSDETISNAGLIIFSYPNISLQKNFDFIEYAFNNNINYIILDFLEDFKIENNIFGYKLDSIIVYYTDDIKGVKYFLINSKEILEQNYMEPNNSLLKVILEEGYSFNIINITFDYYVNIIPPNNISEINEYCDEINDIYGNKNYRDSYDSETKKSIFNAYNIYTNESLETICNDTNCILCLGIDINYCIVCKGNYIFIPDDEYRFGKKKICTEVQNDINNTDEFSNSIIISNDIKMAELTNSEKFNKDVFTYSEEISNNINIDKLSNENYLLSDYESLNTNTLKNIDEITNIISESYFNENNKVTEINNDITDEISNKKNIISDKYKDEISNIKGEQSDRIINYISNTNRMISDYSNNLSYNIYSDEISYELNTDELSENKKISDINSFADSTNMNKDEISNKNEYSIISDQNENIFPSNNHSTNDSIIFNSEKLSYLNNMSSDNLAITDIFTNNNGTFIEKLMNDNFKDINLSHEQIKKLYEDIKQYIIEKYNGDNTIINTGNVKIQISNIDAQKYSEELSNIDLGECGEILKKKYCKKENDSLIMMKFDIKQEKETSTYVQYEIYEPLSKIFLDLKECSKNKISIDVPIELDSQIEGLYQRLLESGYNLFDSNDTFYHDICATYTTQNGTDILLYDRRKDIYQSTVNISLCQDGCDFQSYNTITKKAKCYCSIQTKKINLDISELKFDKNEMIDQFFETLDNSNFRVLICYKLVFNLKVFKKNIGCIFMTILLFLFEILIIIYIIIGSKKINEFIQIIIKNKYFTIENNNSNINLNNHIIEFEDKNNNSNINNNYNESKIKIIKRKKLKEKNQTIRKKKNKGSILRNILHLEGIRNAKKKTSKNIKIKRKVAPPKRRYLIKNKNNEDLKLDSKLENLSSKKNKNKCNDIPISEEKIENLDNSKSAFENKESKQKFKKKDFDIYNKFDDKKKLKSISKSRKVTAILSPRNNNHTIYQQKENDLNSYKKKQKNKSFDKMENQKENLNNLNIEELNNLEYEKAIKIDKRTYFQYYFSLLKKKHLILFTFFPTNDYNVMTLKISLFLVSFSLYLNINGFFFNDDTMHKIYENNGAYDIIAQIPKILYSSLISSIINIILKTLSLSEKNILKIKQENNIMNTVKKSKEIEKCIKIKFAFFYLLSLILMLFFWYFFSCFCAVYSNTQVILFKDTLISFSLSMLYPIGINLVPGIFRISSLRAEKKNKKCMYSFSKILALI